MKLVKLLDVKMDVKDRNELIAMSKDFIKYGYTFKFLKTYDYPMWAIEEYGESELKKCWDIAYDDMCNL